MTLTAFIIIGITILVCAFIQGATGMGFAMIAAPVVTLLDPSLIPVAILLLMIPLNGYIGFRERTAIDWRGVKWVSIGRFAGTFLGLWILFVVNLQQLSLLIGWSTVLAAAVALVAPAFDPNRTGLVAVGLITGITETSTGVGGPPLALAFQHKAAPVLRSTVALCFLVGEVISVIVLAVSGKFTLGTLIATAALLPFLAVGSWASRFVHHRLDGPLLRYIVLGFAVVSGVVVIIQAW
ncbi:sulfite exporter TauE/SafE family protein [Microbacterium esteraromaticum]|uniref:Probable membrane transporter protein n=1 Tax=Microbacterium esteraromaticum TaxID=57043 RepID=A0A7D7W978_9MICO|nr:sulfite exporter TauE/SafE family protein [Microbacterium esteraromaticum]QMU96898.1 sulfite exporter TauE/SafE family protein [Microbacterium esteraromaticum]